MSISTTRRLTLFVQRFGPLYLIDIFIWTTAIVSAELLRFDFDLSYINVRGTAVLLVGLYIALFGFGVITGLYRSRYKTGSFDEIRAIFLTSLGVMGLGLGITIAPISELLVPRSTVLIATPIAFSLMGLARYIVRGLHENRLKPGITADPTIIFGAGFAGTYTAQRLLTDKSIGLMPVGFVDDDPDKRNFSTRGVRVLGKLNDLEEVASVTGAKTVLVCVGHADSVLLNRVLECASNSGLRVLVLPPFDQLIRDPSSLSVYKELSIEDLIGRHPVNLETDTISQYIRGSKILVTGAGGSIGSELCRQLVEFNPAELIMLDRDETALQETQIRLYGHGLLDSREVVLADIRDFEALSKIFQERQPDVVFHAAALKHVPMLEQYPMEAWKTNVLGTQNVLDASVSSGVSTFINISTDKAASPTSVLGHSKRVAEKITAAAGEVSGKRYLSVRFGNVIGSRGSMLPTFQYLIDAGGPLTITHPEVTRFFMTIPEACQLVIQAGAIGRTGEVLILDMGEPIRILDVAKRMISQSGKDIEIVFTGLRKGEKLHEDLFSPDEIADKPFHEKISHSSVKALHREKLDLDSWMMRITD